MPKILQAVTVHGYKEEKEMKSTCTGTRSDFRNRKDENIMNQNLTRRKIFFSKSDTLCFFMQHLTSFFFKIQTMTRCISLNSKSDM